MTTKVTVEVSNTEKSAVVVMENYVGQKQNRVAHMIMPGNKKEFHVHSHLNLNILEVQGK